MQIRSHFLVFSTYGDLGYVQVLCLVTQQRHIKRRQTRQIRREERLSDSCLPGWVTLLRDPLRGAQPWVTSVPQSGRKDFKHKACTTSTPLAAPFLLLFSRAPRGISEDHPSSHHAMNQSRLSSCCHHALLLSLCCYECGQNPNKSSALVIIIPPLQPFPFILCFLDATPPHTMDKVRRPINFS